MTTDTDSLRIMYGLLHAAHKIRMKALAINRDAEGIEEQAKLMGERLLGMDKMPSKPKRINNG